jgi:hypothetical protein
LEDMLRACALQHGGSWDKSLPYAEFSYNNSYQASLKMSPFEALYGRKCRTPLYWDQTGERQFFGPELILELTYEYLQKRKYTSLKGCSSPKGRKVKATVRELIFLNIVPISMAI